MNEKSEQIDARLNVVVDCDQPLRGKELFGSVADAFPQGMAETVNVEVDGALRKAIRVDGGNGGTHYFFPAAVTFLGGSGCHPVFKKRIQLKNWLKSAYCELVRTGAKVHFLGVYRYCGNVIFVDFGPETYVRRKMNNSSAFVYVNDLFRAMKDGVSTRKDWHGNTITAIRRDMVAKWTAGEADGPRHDWPIICRFEEFNRTVPFLRWTAGKGAIEEMHKAGWPKWRETEWPGWYLEYLFAGFLDSTGCRDVVYLGGKTNHGEWLDFDLFFPMHKFYGDLKASDTAKKQSPGNDRESLFEAISRFDRFWYVIYEHDTVKDKDCGNEVTRFRHEFLLSLGEDSKSPLSYAARMKNKVMFRRMMILELNRANCGEALTLFHQGRQPDGSPRAVKVLISKRNVDNFLVYRYDADSGCGGD